MRRGAAGPKQPCGAMEANALVTCFRGKFSIRPFTASARSASLAFVDLTTSTRARHAWGMAMPEVSETDFAIIVFREDDQWGADVLPVAVTDDLTGFIRVLRQQPCIAGTIGLAGI